MLNTESIKTFLIRLPTAGKGEHLLRFSITLLLALLLARTGADLTWRLAAPLLSRESSSSTSLLPRQAAPRTTSRSSTKPRTSDEIALFGQAAGSSSFPESLPLEAVPVTTLNLILKGVIATQPMQRALAIIADKSGNSEQLYGLGEQIPGNATIREIYADRVIISRGGVLETLFLEGSQPEATTKSATKPSRNANRTGIAEIKDEGNGTNYQINQNYWEERLADLPGLSREIGVEIYKEGNEQKGYRLLSSQSSKLLNNLGLHAGDILLSVNGRAMDSVQNGLAAYQQIRNGGQVQIDIIHNGQRESRVYNIGD